MQRAQSLALALSLWLEAVATHRGRWHVLKRPALLMAHCKRGRVGLRGRCLLPEDLGGPVSPTPRVLAPPSGAELGTPPLTPGLESTLVLDSGGSQKGQPGKGVTWQSWWGLSRADMGAGGREGN